MELYCWGANSHGQLGQRMACEMFITPVKVTDLPFAVDSIKQIQGGGGHVLILLDCGTIYSCGWNCDGQLGINSTEDQYHFQKIIFDPETTKIDKVYCGWKTSGAITSEGQLYVWGSNRFRDLIPPVDEVPILKIPTELVFPNEEKVLDVSFGMRHTIVLMANRYVYLFDKSRNQTVIKSDLKETVLFNNIKLTKLFFESPISHIAAGEKHFALALENNVIHLIGDNAYEQCADGRIKVTKDICDLVSGWKHNACLIDGGGLFLWGRNCYGQLGIFSSKEAKKPGSVSFSEKIKSIHLGAEHALIITQETGHVFTWGWNEHGNCGNNSTENVQIPVRVDLEGRCTVAGCGAGFCYAVIKRDTC